MRWTRLDANQADAPSPRYGHVAVVVDTRDDWGTELVIVHGGTTKLPSEQEAFLEDVSLFHVEQEAWVRPQISSDISPGPRAFHAATAVDKGLVFFGGQALIPNTASRTTFHDAWSLNVDTWAWKRMAEFSPVCPSPRSLSSIVYTGDRRLVMFGGRNESSKSLNDLWMLHLDRDIWEQVLVSGPMPPPRIKQAMAFADGAVWLYGGETTTGSFFDDLWVLREVEGSGQWLWNLVKARPKPIGRSGHCLTPTHDGLLACFGGHMASPVYMIFSQSHTCSKEFWILDLPQSRWVKCETADDQACPVERVCPTMVSLGSSRLFIFGGRGKDKILGDSWWLDLDFEEVRTPSSQSLSSLTSSALPMQPLGTKPPKSEAGQETVQSSEASKQTMSNLFLGSVWSSIPSLPSRGLLSRITARTSTEKAAAQKLHSPHSRLESIKDQEMVPVNNGNEDAIRTAEQLSEGLETLFSYFDIDRDGTEAPCFSSQPADHYVDSALISYAQSSSVPPLTSQQRSHEVAVAEGRRVLMNTEAKEFKIGDLWLLLADYKRLLLQSDVLKTWREQQTSVRPQLNTRFLHFTMENLRLSDLPELLLDYRHLLEST